MEPLMESMLKSAGRLRKRFLPALYLDPSFFAGWVDGARALADGQEDEAGYAAVVRRVRGMPSSGAPSGNQPDAPSVGAPSESPPDAPSVGASSGSQAGTMHVVVSALTVLRWMQEVAPRYRSEDDAGREPSTREESEFAGMRLQSWLNRHLGDALAGLLQVDVQGFSLPIEQVWEEVPALAILDGEARCTLHALMARHLGCTALATVRPEMVRICEVLQASGGPRPLLGPRSVLAALG